MALLTALVIRGLELLSFYVFDYLPGSERLEDNLGLSYFCLLDFSPTRGVDQMVSSCLVAGVMEHVSRPPLQHGPATIATSCGQGLCGAPAVPSAGAPAASSCSPPAALLQGLQTAVFRGGCPRQPGPSHVLEASEEVRQGELTRTLSPATRSSDPHPQHCLTSLPQAPCSLHPQACHLHRRPASQVGAGRACCTSRDRALAQLQSRMVSFYRSPSHPTSLESSPSSLSQPQDALAPFPFLPACLLPRSRESIPPYLQLHMSKSCFVPGIELHVPLHSFSKPSLGGRHHYSDLRYLGPGEVPSLALCGYIKPGSDCGMRFIPGLQSLHFAHRPSSLLLGGRARPQRTDGALTLVVFPSGPNAFG